MFVLVKRKNLMAIVLIIISFTLMHCGQSDPPPDTPDPVPNPQPGGTIFNLTINISPANSGEVTPNKTEYAQGDTVTLTATPQPGWQFSHWQNTESNYQNPVPVTINNNITVTAIFIHEVIRTVPLNYSPFTGPAGPGPITDEANLAKLEPLIHRTNKIRTFTSSMGMENTADLAAQLGIEVVAGVYLSTDLTQNQIEINNAIALAQDGKVNTIIVGNEILLFNTLTANQLIDYIRQVKQAVPANVKVSYSDTWDTLIAYPSVVAECDVIMANIYAYWEGVHIDYAVFRTRQAYLELVDTYAPKEVIIAEAGWPSDGNGFGEAVTNPTNAAYFFKSFVSWVTDENIDYFYFEAYNEAWKAAIEGPEAEFWGVLDSNDNVKTGMQDVYDGLTAADNWSGEAVVGGPGAPDIYFTYVPPLGDSSWIEGEVNHVAPADYAVAVFIHTVSGWYNKPTWTERLTMIYPDGWWTCNYATGSGDENADEIIAFLVPASYDPPMVGGGPIPNEVYNNAVDWQPISR